MSDFEKVKVGEYAGCEIWKYYHQGKIPFKEYVCKLCGHVFATKETAVRHKCQKIT
jgi:hypothetical protein